MSAPAGWLARAIAVPRLAAGLWRGRVLMWSGALLVEQVALFVCLVLWAFGAFGTSRPPVVADFPSFYAAGSLALAGTPQLAYDHAALWQAERAVAGAATPFNYFFYPPPYLLLCAGLAALPYMAAFVLFEAATLWLYVLVVRRIAGIGGWAWCLPALAFPAVFWTLGLGQNAFLTAALFGAGTLLLPGRPGVAGGMLGLLCYKPHFGLLVPVALAAGGHWRAFAAAACSVAALVAVTAGLFGVETWRRYLDAFAASAEVYTSGKIMLAGFVTTFGAARLIGLPVAVAGAAQVATGIAAALIVARLWHARAGLPVCAAALIAGTLLAVPLALLYDLMLISVCIAWLVRAAGETGFLPWEKSLLAFLFVIAFVCFFVGLVAKVPLGPLAPAIVLALCLRRAGLKRLGASVPSAEPCGAPAG